LLQEALGCRATRVWLPGLYCPKVAGALKRIGLRLAYYDLNSDLVPVIPSEASMSAVALPRMHDLVIGLYPFGLARNPPTQFLAGRRFVLDACHALRTVLSGAGNSSHGPVVVSLRKEFGGMGKAWLLHPGEIGQHVSAHEDWPCTSLSDATVRGRAVTRLVADALGRYLPLVGARDVLTHLPLLATDRNGTVEALRAKGIEAWYWQRPLPGWSPDIVPNAARLRQSLLLVPAPPCEDRTGYLLDTLRTLDLCPWRPASDAGRDRQPIFSI